MRYFELKTGEAENDNGQPVNLTYKSLFETMLMTNSQLSTDQFLRLSKVYNNAVKAKDGDVIEIEDQDYSVVKLKLDAYVELMTKNAGASLKFQTFQGFVEDVLNMPKEAPKAAPKAE